VRGDSIGSLNKIASIKTSEKLQMKREIKKEIHPDKTKDSPAR